MQWLLCKILTAVLAPPGILTNMTLQIPSVLSGIGPNFTLVLSVTEFSSPTWSVINRAFHYLSVIQSQGLFRGYLLVIDKSGQEFEAGSPVPPPGVGVKILKRPKEESLVGSISKLSSVFSGESASWVQVIAEDDTFLPTDQFVFKPQDNQVMFLPKMVFVGKAVEIANIIRTPFSVEDIRGTYTNAQLEGDISWHGVLREDVFLAYACWLRSLKNFPNVVSNVSVWIALSKGTVAPLENFVYVKEASFYDSIRAVREREERSLLSIFGQDLTDVNWAINMVAKLSLVKSVDTITNTGLHQQVFAHLLREAQTLFNGPTRTLSRIVSFALRKGILRKQFVWSIFPPALDDGGNDEMLKQVIRRAKVVLGKSHNKVLENFRLMG